MSDIEKLRVGDKVRVIDDSLQSYGLVGTVTINNYYDTNAYVRFEDWHGQGTKELCISISKLAKILNESDGNIMNVKGNYEVAMVKFVNGTNTEREYAFALFDTNVCVGDIVLCDTSNGYNVARIVRIIRQSEYTGVVTKEIICPVDFSAFEERKERRKQKEKLKKQMDRMVKDNQELVLYQMLAEKNSEMAEMLAPYKSLGDI